jgi:putative two-component system protein, hydrogenase maturation factor HypX/HoxX
MGRPSDRVSIETPTEIAGSLRLLFLVSADNGLSRRAQIELTGRGHDLAVAVAGSVAEMEAAVDEHRPELIVCPFLQMLIPESIWSAYRCLIVHPGPWGDHGPSTLDWSIDPCGREGSVTVIEASGAHVGTVWATRDLRVHEMGRSSLYRYEMRRRATEALVEAIDRIVCDQDPVPAHGSVRRPRTMSGTSSLDRHDQARSARAASIGQWRLRR